MAIIKKDSIVKLKALLKKANHLVIVTHWSPDGDAMGSSLAWFNYLVKLQKKVTVIVPNEYPEFLHWLPGDNKVLNHQIHPEKVAKTIEKADAIFTLDFNSFKRLEKLGEIVDASKATKILIDHHQQPDKFAQIVFHDVKACSTCELIYDIILALGGKNLIDKKIAACIYTGLMTDTGSFRFSSVTSKTHLILADLLDKGAVPNQIHEAIYDTYAANRLKLLGHSLSQKMVVMPEKKLAFITLTHDELDHFNYQKGDTEGLVNYPLSINGIKFSGFFVEMDGKVKISFRSKGKFDVNTFARNYFNGGGHINAAGGKSDLNLNETITKFLSIVNNPEFKVQ